MRTLRSIRSPQDPVKGPRRRSGTRLRALLSAAAAASMLVAIGARVTPVTASAMSAPDQAKAKRYKGTRPVIVDQQSGAIRLPTQQEVDAVVANLSTLGQRPTETLQQASQPNGAVTVNLDGGFAGILLARPNGDGTWETKCVFTLEEGAEFLGIVEDDASR
jgi:hypothetical protein